jgi:hypothetical protein
MAHIKEKRDKIEPVIDWLRKLIIKKEKKNKIVLTVLDEEYLNILNSIGKKYGRAFSSENWELDSTSLSKSSI